MQTIRFYFNAIEDECDYREPPYLEMLSDELARIPVKGERIFFSEEQRVRFGNLYKDAHGMDREYGYKFHSAIYDWDGVEEVFFDVGQDCVWIIINDIHEKQKL
jgi:hypothetical protein